ncbi:MAG: hypothetical protein IPL26_11525 [Leptospiraceae bacterium]|nr:hypothetical protein [Leptospiraceae bacterium]
MSKKLEVIEYVFVHLDGVLLDNIYRHILEAMVKKWGGKYTAEVENNAFAQSKEHITSFLNNHFHLALSSDEVLKIYYEERAKVEKKFVINKKRGILKFLKLMHFLDLKVLGYGGAGMEYFSTHMSKYSHFFSDEKYIRTNTMRPGVKEIIKEVYNLKYKQALFIDETNTVALVAKKHKVPFIGIPSLKTGFQKKEMVKSNVKYLIRSLDEIDYSLLKKIDKEAKENLIWYHKGE